MKTRLSLPVQWFLALLIGLVLGFTFNPNPIREKTPPIASALTATPAIATILSPSPNMTASPAPFVTLSGGWMVRVTFYQKFAPQIIKVIHLDQARLTTYPVGDNQIQLLNTTGPTLYTQSFQVEFMAGEPAQPVDEKTMIFVLPALEGSTQVIIQTPNGKVSYDLPGQ